MAGFDLDQLRTLAAVAEAGSLTAAGPRLFLSQSALSEQVRKLEERAGQPLFTRSKAGMALTPAGERLLGYARRILELSEQALRDLRGLSLEGDVRFGLTDYFRPLDVAGLLARLKASLPAIRLRVSIMKSDRVEAAYERGELDVGIAMTHGGPRRHGVRGRTRILRREPLVWMAAPGTALHQPLPLLALPESCALRRYTEQVLAGAGIDYVVAHEASGVAGLQSALAAGLGVACLNQSAMAPGIAALPARLGLPALPRAHFHLLPARAGEPEFMARVRDAVAAYFA